MKPASIVRKLNRPWEGEAFLVRLSKPLRFFNITNGQEQITFYVVVSGIHNGGNFLKPCPETMIFPSDGYGTPIMMTNIATIMGEINHEAALNQIGFSIVD